MKKLYKKYMLEYGYEEKYSLEERTCPCDISFIKLRDGLLFTGHVLKEDLENKIYVVSIKTGIFGSNNAVVICGLEEKELKMVAFAREGLIKQNTCKKAMDRIEELLK